MVAAAARRAGLRVEIDLRNEKINYKVREHSLAKIPALLVVGKKEAETHSVSIRRLGSDGQKVMPTDEAIAALVEEATPPDVKRMRAAELIIIGLNRLPLDRLCRYLWHSHFRRKRSLVPDAIELLKIRRSVKPREMSGPGPSPAELDTILTIGARVPDHGKLTPWRFIVFEGDARARAGDIIAQVFAKKNPHAPAADIEVEKRRLMDAPLVIARGQLHQAAPQGAGVGAGTVRRRQRDEHRHRGHRARLWRQLADRLVRVRPRRARWVRIEGG